MACDSVCLFRYTTGVCCSLGLALKAFVTEAIRRRGIYTKGVRGGVAGRGRRGEPPARGSRDSTRCRSGHKHEIYFTFSGARRGDEPTFTEQKHTHDR